MSIGSPRPTAIHATELKSDYTGVGDALFRLGIAAKLAIIRSRSVSMRLALVSSLFVAAVGSAVPAMAADGTPTFTKDVAPIFYK
jgi:hypothetical protein